MMTSSRSRFLSSLVALLAIVGAEAQNASELPHLVVNIIIDQLRTDYLEAFDPLYGVEGFSRFAREGRTYSQAQYPFDSPDRASAIACFMTGASPYENGIVGERWLDRQSLIPVFCVDDKRHPGCYTAECSSPQHLAVSTLGDELKIATDGQALVYAVSPCRDAAILAAGHAADGAFWLNDETGAWSGSTYYGVFPSWVGAYEKGSSLSSRIGKMVWTPLNERVENFDFFRAKKGAKRDFAHKFSGERKYTEFKTTACVNDEVNRFVKHLYENTDIGRDDVTDMLTLTYYAGGYDHQSASQYGMEQQDIYARLDRQLAELMAMTDRRVGANRVLYVVTSSGYAEPEDVKDLSAYRIPTGTFSITKAQLLLNMYLIAVYGPGDYVETAMGNELYLNLKLIEDRSINLTEMLERCGDFLIQMGGVRDVYTSQRLAQGAGAPGVSKLRNAYNPKCSGDILVQVMPGWVLENENTHERTLCRESYMGFPLMMMGCGMVAEKVHQPVTIDQVAPTLARVMRIRAPNACSSAPLSY